MQNGDVFVNLNTHAQTPLRWTEEMGWNKIYYALLLRMKGGRKELGMWNQGLFKMFGLFSFIFVSKEKAKNIDLGKGDHEYLL